MPDALARLAVAHWSEQNRLAAAVREIVARSYGARMTTLADPTVEAWIAEMVPRIRDYYARSAGVSAAYYRRARILGGAGIVGLPDLSPAPLSDEAVTISLRATGLSEAIGALERGEPFEEALKVGRIAAEGASLRHALDGGRTTLGAAWAGDRVRVGAYRITQVGCCSFCAMLASRGAVYREDSFDASDPRFEGDLSDVKAHDHDRCTLGFVYGDSQVPDFNTQMADLWRSVTRDENDRITLTGKAAERAFRRAYEALLQG